MGGLNFVSVYPKLVRSLRLLEPTAPWGLKSSASIPYQLQSAAYMSTLKAPIKGLFIPLSNRYAHGVPLLLGGIHAALLAAAWDSSAHPHAPSRGWV